MGDCETISPQISCVHTALAKTSLLSRLITLFSRIYSLKLSARNVVMWCSPFPWLSSSTYFLSITANTKLKVDEKWASRHLRPFCREGLLSIEKSRFFQICVLKRDQSIYPFSIKLSPPSTFRPPSRRWLTLWGESVILKQLPNLLLRLRRCSTDSVICQVKKVNCLSLRHTYWPQRGLLIYKHIKWSAPHHRCQSRRFKGCFEITV